MNILNNLIFTIKNNTRVRAIVMPIINSKRAKATLRYEDSIEAKRIRSLKGIYNGKRCFLIGNGPSLRVEDLELLKNEITFGANRIYRIFDDTTWRPDYYVAFEPEYVTQNIEYLKTVPVNRARFLNNRAYTENTENTYWINCTSKFCIEKETTESIFFSEDISKSIGDGYSVTFTMLQIAIYMGFSEIYLVGMDHNKGNRKTTHYYKDAPKDYRTPTFWNGIEYAYTLAKEHADEKGILIANLTRGGQLEVFPRMEFDKVVVDNG